MILRRGWFFSIRHASQVLLCVALLCDNPVERPGRRLFVSVFGIIGEYVYLPMSSCFKIPGLKISLLETAFVFLGVSVLVQYAHFDHKGWRKQPVVVWFGVYLGTLLTWVLYGLCTGGALRFAVLQIRVVAFLPLVLFVFAHAFSRLKDVYQVLGILLCVCVVRSVEIVYYHFTVTRATRAFSAEGGDGYYVLTHSDALLAAVVLVMLCVWLFEYPQRHYQWAFFLCSPVILLATVLNNRRIAFVALFLGLVPFVVLARNAVKRRFSSGLKMVLPLLCVYVVLGWGARKQAWAKPVQIVRSMFENKDTSSATRDIENYNLIYTFKTHPLMGMGFGHTYIEQVKAYDISHFFEAYLYVPHNSVLGLWSSLGLLGYTLFSLFLSVWVYYAAQVYQRSHFTIDRVCAVVSIASVMGYHVMSYGDMGMQSWMCTLVLCACLGSVLGRLRVGLCG
jgi:hypothetical protein